MYDDYGYTYSYSTAGAGISVGYMIFCLAFGVVAIVSMWRIFTKAGEPGWAAIIPFYNCFVFFKIAWGKGIYFLLTFIPFVGFVFAIIAWVKLTKAFGKGAGFAVGLIFLNPIFAMILAFDKSEYIGLNGIPNSFNSSEYASNGYNANSNYGNMNSQMNTNYYQNNQMQNPNMNNPMQNMGNGGVMPNTGMDNQMNAAQMNTNYYQNNQMQNPNMNNPMQNMGNGGVMPNTGMNNQMNAAQMNNNYMGNQPAPMTNNAPMGAAGVVAGTVGAAAAVASEPAIANGVTCSICGMQNNPNDKFCSKCGNPQETVNKQQTYICIGCGFVNETTDQFCRNCGKGRN